MSATEDTPSSGGAPENAPPQTPWEEMQRSDEFRTLRDRWRRFIFTMSAIFLTWFLFYVLMGAFAQDVMNIRVFGNITLGLLLGLGQFVSTFVIAVVYMKFADKNIDPPAEELRVRLEEKL